MSVTQADIENLMRARATLAQRIIGVALDQAESYRRAISNFSSEEQKDRAEKCARAASNTGWFILKELGYSDDEINQAKQHP